MPMRLGRSSQASKSQAREEDDAASDDRSRISAMNASAVLAAAAAGPVYTGDLMMFHAFRADGVRCFLSGNGITSEDVYLVSVRQMREPELGDLRDSIFRVVPQLSYTALKEQQRASSASTADLAVLQAKAKLEDDQNRERMALRNPVRNGDVVQLLHVKSGNFLTVAPKQKGNHAGTLRVALRPGGPYAALVAQPFYKHLGIGEPLMCGLQVLFATHKPRSGWFIYSDMTQEGEVPAITGKGTAYEVNCFTEASLGLSPVLYSRDGSGCLQYGQTVRITCPQSNRALGASCSTAPVKAPFFSYREADRPGSFDSFWSKGLWFLETKERVRGRDVQWGFASDGSTSMQHAFCLRHLGTGYYLSVERTPAKTPPVDGGRSGQRHCKARLLPEADYTCLFLMDPLVKGTPLGGVPMSADGLSRALVRFEDGEGSLWLSCESDVLKKKGDSRLRPSLECYFGDVRHNNHAVIMECLNITHPDVVDASTRVMAWRSAFVEATASLKAQAAPGTARPATASPATASPARKSGFTKKANPAQANPAQANPAQAAPATPASTEVQRSDSLFPVLEALCSAAIRYLTQSPELSDGLQCPKHSWPFAQRLVRELKLIDASVELMDALWNAGYKVKRLVSRTVVRLPASKTQDTASDLPAIQLRCLKLLVELWRCCFQDNRENEDYFLRKGWLENINKLNGLGLGAGGCLGALVSNNDKCLQGVTPKMMEQFVDFIGKLGPDDTWLRFMEACCSCQGKAVGDKQLSVLHMLYDQGEHATAAEKSKWGKNRQQFLLATKLASGVKHPVPENAAAVCTTSESPGQQVVQTGVRDICISWSTSMEPWDVGMDWLYWHPKYLELSVLENTKPGPNATGCCWVSLADLSWVLSPELCYELVRTSKPTGSWAKEGTEIREQGSFKARVVLAKYFVSQIDLLSEVCLQEQVNSISAIQKEYSVDLICNALWDFTLPPDVRRSFCRLFNILWINRYPHLQVQPVRLCFSWDELCSASQATVWLPTFELDLAWLDSRTTSKFESHSSASKFEVLVAFVRHHLSVARGRMVHSHSESTRYTASVAQLLLDLLKHGFLHNEDQITGILPSMLDLLDGRTDWLDCPPVNLEAKDARKNSTAVRNDSEDPPTPSSSGPLLTWSNTPDTGTAESSHNGASKPLYLQMPDPASSGPSRYPAKPESIGLQEAKVFLCQACAVITEMAVGNGVTQLARLFAEKRRSTAGQEEVAEPTSSEAEKALSLLRPRQFDLDHFAGTSFNTMLMDLMMYENPAIFVAAARAMQLWNSRVANILDKSSEIIILSDSSETKMYQQLKCYVARLANLINSCEDWGMANSHGPIDNDRYKQVAELLEKLRCMCSMGDENVDTEEPNTKVQSMLASFRLGEELIKALDTPQSSLRATPNGVLHEFMKLVCKLMYQYVSGHARNQQALYQHLTKLRTWTGDLNVGAANAIAGIFRENRMLCEKMPEELVYEVGQAIVGSARSGEGFLPQRMDFLLSILVTGKRPIVRNKEIVLRLLRNPNYAEVLHLMDDAAGLKRRETLLQGFNSLPEFQKPPIMRNWSGGDGEIQYHNKSLQLIATLCVGRDHSGAPAFAQAKVPPGRLVESYQSVVRVHAQKTCSRGCSHMCTILKRTLLSLLSNAYYDTDLKDRIFYASALHCELLGTIISDLDRLRNEMQTRTLETIDEDLVFQTLRTLAAFADKTPESSWHPSTRALLDERLCPMLSEMSWENYPKVKSVSSLKALVPWTLACVTKERVLGQCRSSQLETPGSPRPGQKTNDVASDCKSFFAKLRSHPVMQKAVEEEQAKMISDVCTLTDDTDPNNTSYQEEKDSAFREGRAVQNGFRRNTVATVVFIQRAISHCLQADHLRDWDTTSFVIKTVCEVLQAFAEKDDLAEMQVVVADAGGQRLVIDTLCARPGSELVQQTLHLAAALLKPNNKAVQQIFTDYFLRIDDFELWNLFKEKIEVVTLNVKTVRQLKRVCQQANRPAKEVLTLEESESLADFSESLETMERSIRFMQLLCESQNMHMQQYLYQQTDNSASFNVLEKAVQVCVKICKNEAAADVCDQEEVAAMITCFELLIESTTRPDPRNQLYLATSAIVTAIAGMSRARFLNLRCESGDCYPDSVRELMARATELLLVILELRQDSDVHMALLLPLDPKQFGRRLIFIHRWFLSQHLGFCTGSEPHQCDDNGACGLDDPWAQDGITVPDVSPMDLLEGFTEDDMIDMLSEAFNIMLILQQLRPHDEEFRKQTEPVVPELDEGQRARMSAEAWAEAELAVRFAEKQRDAYVFFNGWIKMVEIQADGRIFDFHFRMPVLCTCVLGSEKDTILNEVTIESPEAKIKDFIARSVELYDMTVHTRDISQWSPAVCSCVRVGAAGKPPRPLLFFLKNDSENLTRTTYICLGLAVLLNILLIEGLRLPQHGSFPVVQGGALALGTWLLGLVYGLLMFTSLLVTCITYTPMDHSKILQDSQARDIRCCETFVILGLVLLLALVPYLMHLPKLGLMLAATGLLLQAGAMWQPDASGCPRNCVARAVATFYASIQRPPVFRHAFFFALVLAALLGADYCYTFLLLDVVFMSEKLRNVVKAVIIPVSSLMLTTMVGCIILYEYAAVGFFYFRPDYHDSCQNMLDCTLSTVYIGLRDNLGAHLEDVDVTAPNWYGRMAFDLSFFVLITTVLMNILFGIIVDTFGALRDEVQEREIYMRSTTFISCLDRSEVDKAALAEGLGSGFAYLESERQHVWNYMNFIFYLLRKDPLSLTGPESHILRCIDAEDISWVPISTCALLERQAPEPDAGDEAAGEVPS